jgi:hypothetical protein
VLTERQRDLALLGLCPYCEQPIRAYRAPSASRRIDDLLTSGIDPMTGHRMDCAMPEVRL